MLCENQRLSGLEHLIKFGPEELGPAACSVKSMWRCLATATLMSLQAILGILILGDSSNGQMLDAVVEETYCGIGSQGCLRPKNLGAGKTIVMLYALDEGTAGEVWDSLRNHPELKSATVVRTSNSNGVVVGEFDTIIFVSALMGLAFPVEGFLHKSLWEGYLPYTPPALRTPSAPSEGLDTLNRFFVAAQTDHLSVVEKAANGSSPSTKTIVQTTSGKEGQIRCDAVVIRDDQNSQEGSIIFVDLSSAFYMVRDASGYFDAAYLLRKSDTSSFAEVSDCLTSISG